VDCRILRHPLKLAQLLPRIRVDALNELFQTVPEHVFCDFLAALLADVPYRRLVSTVPPLLNDPSCREALFRVMCAMDAGTVVQLINNVPVAKLALVMRASASKLERLVGAIEPRRAAVVLIPVLQAPHPLLEWTLLPLIARVRHPERIAALANQVEPSLLVALLQGADEMQLSTLVNSLCDADFLPEGAAIRLLQLVSNDRPFVDYLVPLIQHGDAENIAILLHGVGTEQLLKVLHRVSAEGVLRLLDHVNPEIVVSLCNGPLEKIIPAMAKLAGKAMKNRTVATVSERVTNRMANSITTVRRAADKGKMERGASSEDPDQSSDVCRGFVTRWTKKTKFMEPFAYTVGEQVQVWSRSRLEWLDGAVLEVIPSVCNRRRTQTFASVKVFTSKFKEKLIRSQDVHKLLRKVARERPSFIVDDTVRVWCGNRCEWVDGVVDLVCEAPSVGNGVSIEKGAARVVHATGEMYIQSGQFGFLLLHAPAMRHPKVDCGQRRLPNNAC
jgi:hypothetical protein